jgi:cation diffusion facilitator CzcD-associated flavoprotein CzcO
LPQILPKAKKLTNFIRRPTWVAPPLRGLDQHIYTPEELDDFANKPGHLLAHRKKYQSSTSAVFGLFIRGSETQQNIRKMMLDHMKTKLHDDRLEKMLIPTWSVGCRRLTPGISYLEALHDERVELVQRRIQEITPDGCVTDDGQQHVFDVLVCATGFDVSFKPRFPLLGRGGRNLQDIWKDEAKGYLGLAAPDMPNYFVFLGPNCPIGNGPILKAIGISPLREVSQRYPLTWCHRSTSRLYA